MPFFSSPKILFLFQQNNPRKIISLPWISKKISPFKRKESHCGHVVTFQSGLCPFNYSPRSFYLQMAAGRGEFLRWAMRFSDAGAWLPFKMVQLHLFPLLWCVMHSCFNGAAAAGSQSYPVREGCFNGMDILLSGRRWREISDQHVRSCFWRCSREDSESMQAALSLQNHPPLLF